MTTEHDAGSTTPTGTTTTGVTMTGAGAMTAAPR